MITTVYEIDLSSPEGLGMYWELPISSFDLESLVVSLSREDALDLDEEPLTGWTREGDRLLFDNQDRFMLFP